MSVKSHEFEADTGISFFVTNGSASNIAAITGIAPNTNKIGLTILRYNGRIVIIANKSWLK